MERAGQAEDESGRLLSGGRSEIIPPHAEWQRFTRELFAGQNVTVLPGSYLAREMNGLNPGRNRVRISLTASVEQCVAAAERIRSFLSQRKSLAT